MVPLLQFCIVRIPLTAYCWCGVIIGWLSLVGYHWLLLVSSTFGASVRLYFVIMAFSGASLLTSGRIQQTTNWWCFFSFLIFPRKQDFAFHANCLQFYFSQKKEFDISCKLSPLETICMRCQILFSGKNKKRYFKTSSAEHFTQSAKR